MHNQPNYGRGHNIGFGDATLAYAFRDTPDHDKQRLPEHIKKHLDWHQPNGNMNMGNDYNLTQNHHSHIQHGGYHSAGNLEADFLTQTVQDGSMRFNDMIYQGGMFNQDRLVPVYDVGNYQVTNSSGYQIYLPADLANDIRYAEQLMNNGYIEYDHYGLPTMVMYDNYQRPMEVPLAILMKEYDAETDAQLRQAREKANRDAELRSGIQNFQNRNGQQHHGHQYNQAPTPPQPRVNGIYQNDTTNRPRDTMEYALQLRAGLGNNPKSPSPQPNQNRNLNSGMDARNNAGMQQRTGAPVQQNVDPRSNFNAGSNSADLDTELTPMEEKLYHMYIPYLLKSVNSQVDSSTRYEMMHARTFFGIDAGEDLPEPLAKVILRGGRLTKKMVRDYMNNNSNGQLDIRPTAQSQVKVQSRAPAVAQDDEAEVNVVKQAKPLTVGNFTIDIKNHRKVLTRVNQEIVVFLPQHCNVAPPKSNCFKSTAVSDQTLAYGIYNNQLWEVLITKEIHMDLSNFNLNTTEQPVIKMPSMCGLPTELDELVVNYEPSVNDIEIATEGVIGGSRSDIVSTVLALDNDAPTIVQAHEEEYLYAGAVSVDVIAEAFGNGEGKSNLERLFIAMDALKEENEDAFTVINRRMCTYMNALIEHRLPLTIGGHKQAIRKIEDFYVDYEQAMDWWCANNLADTAKLVAKVIEAEIPSILNLVHEDAADGEDAVSLGMSNVVHYLGLRGTTTAIGRNNASVLIPDGLTCGFLSPAVAIQLLTVSAGAFGKLQEAGLVGQHSGILRVVSECGKVVTIARTLNDNDAGKCGFAVIGIDDQTNL